MSWSKHFSFFLCSLAVFSFCLITSSANAQIVINFSDGDQLDGDVVGDTAEFTDATTGVTTTMTHTAGHGGFYIGTHGPPSNRLGLGTSDDDSFDGGEFWSFDFDTDVIFCGLTLGQVDSQLTDAFNIQCDDWIGQGFLPPDTDRVTFNNNTGTFTLDRGITATPTQTYDLNDLTGGIRIVISATSDVTFSVGSFTDVTMFEMVFGAIAREKADSFSVVTGSHDSGGVTELCDSDNQDLVLDPVFSAFRYQLTYTVDANTTATTADEFQFIYETSTFNVVGTVSQTIELFNYDSGQYETIDSRLTSFGDTVLTIIPAGDPGRFIEDGTGNLRARFHYQNSIAFWVFMFSALFLPYESSTDHIQWVFIPPCP